MRLYICGPMTGKPEFNYQAFHIAAHRWRLFGWDVLNPAERFSGQTDLPYTVYINSSMIDIMACDAVAALPGWAMSSGASLEVHYARVTGKPVYDALHPARSGESGLRPATVSVRPPDSELHEDGETLAGVSGCACSGATPCMGCGRNDGATEDGPTDGIPQPQGLLGRLGGLRRGRGKVGRTRPVGIIDASMDDPCSRCLRPLKEHEPFALPSEWGSCENWLP